MVAISREIIEVKTRQLYNNKPLIIVADGGLLRCTVRTLENFLNICVRR